MALRSSRQDTSVLSWKKARAIYGGAWWSNGINLLANKCLSGKRWFSLISWQL